MSGSVQQETLWNLEVPEEPVLSPDGQRIVYVLRGHDRTADRVVRSLWCRGLDGSSYRLTDGQDDRAPAWAPNGRSVAFLRGRPAQLCLLDVDGGPDQPRTLVGSGESAGRPVWSPDGGAIAFTTVCKMLGRNEPMVSDRVDYQFDGAGLVGDLRRELRVLEPVTGTSRAVSAGHRWCGDPSWSPDGRWLAFTAGGSGDADLTFRTEAFLASSDSGDLVEHAVAPGVVARGLVTWTPDGEGLLAVVARPRANHELVRISVRSGGSVPLTASLDRNVLRGEPGYPGAAPVVSGDRVLFIARDAGAGRLYEVPVTGGAVREVEIGAGASASGLTASGGTVALVRRTPTSYGELVVLEDGRSAHAVVCADRKPPVVAQPREFTAPDGATIQGWVLRSPDATQPQPLLLDVHGGPHNSWDGCADEVHLYQQELVSRGWTVVLANPRGSDGYGAAFCHAIAGRWGLADADDLYAVVDALVADGSADSSRLAVSGYSYGGYMACYLTAHDRRFRAAVAGGLVCDLGGVVGTSDVGVATALDEFVGLPWDAPDGYAAMSPWSRVGAVETPTLVMHGAADLRCPLGQAQQWHAALRARRVPSRLVLYPEAGHLFLVEGRPSYREHYSTAVVDWLSTWVGDDAIR
ncbi:S9 family peptidase [Kribbella solani]|uniref:Dipeptidyl aminopeptidase/acylaminoacyl peptidase n=1 Tax=Kribbella solani TaxID=236067 RepID=A0A841DHA1_9ACTN|nr:S9 family peptidase [Kribbella solani]MBB5977281.1 dipeptidyl aminopeptidase/acylaminoacyl peptidase [Kribbella solani]